MIEYVMVVEQQKPITIENQISSLENLSNALKWVSNPSEKLAILDKQLEVAQFLKSLPQLEKLIKDLNPLEQLVIKTLLALGQGPIVFQDFQLVKNTKEALHVLVEQLLEMEKFYDINGGILGYHINVLKLINSKKQTYKKEQVDYEMPPGIDISQESKEVNEAIRWGIDSMRIMGEMYPVGGAGDRLNLKDEETGELLPAAQLLFCGRTLLESLIRDLQGREFLHFKLFDKQLVTPIAIMTSHEKKNHQRIQELCEANEWFGRPRESYRFFIQPLVPMVSIDGDWAISSPMQLILKPGGHGVIWKAALDEGIFEWYASQQKKKVIVRQINNPLAGTDSGLLALSGIGCQKDKDFGFASCQRLVGASEGMNVLREEKKSDGNEYCITNVEYTEFKQCGIEDGPETVGSPYSRFPANTNILFGDLEAIRKAVDVCAIPGMLINLKNRVGCYTSQGVVQKFAGRLESTMQNIADYMADKSPKNFSKDELFELRTFLTYNKRRKTLSVTKQSYIPEKSLNGTPEGCFYDLQQNYRDLLINYCQMTLPSEQSESNYLANGSDNIVLFHPSLGMLYSVIGQKIRGGKLSKGAEWILEISEAEIVNLDLDGSLIVEAESIMGRKNAYGTLTFDTDYCGKCILNNVKVKNHGREPTSGKNAWRCLNQRKEALRITLHGNAEFFAEDVELEGDIHFDVPDGHRLVIYQQGKEIAWHFETIQKASWKWDYYFDDNAKICLEKIKIAH